MLVLLHTIAVITKPKMQKINPTMNSYILDILGISIGIDPSTKPIIEKYVIDLK